MKNSYFIVLGFALILTSSPLVHAQSNQSASSTESQPIQTITFTDGTVLKGNLSSVADGYYIIDTVNLGQVRVPVEKVASIITPGADLPQFTPPVATTSGSTMPSPEAVNNFLASQPQLAGKISQAQKDIFSDPAMMAEIQTLLQDPEIMDLLKDKDVMQDVMGMNPETIQSNPNIQALMQNPKMQDIFNKVNQKMGTSPAALSPAATP